MASDDSVHVTPDVLAWLEPHGAIILKAVLKSGDPVDLGADDARRIAARLVELADEHESGFFDPIGLAVGDRLELGTRLDRSVLVRGGAPGPMLEWSGAWDEPSREFAAAVWSSRSKADWPRVASYLWVGLTRSPTTEDWEKLDGGALDGLGNPELMLPPGHLEAPLDWPLIECEQFVGQAQQWLRGREDGERAHYVVSRTEVGLVLETFGAESAVAASRAADAAESFASRLIGREVPDVYGEPAMAATFHVFTRRDSATSEVDTWIEYEEGWTEDAPWEDVPIVQLAKEAAALLRRSVRAEQ